MLAEILCKEKLDWESQYASDNITFNHGLRICSF